MEGLQNKNEEMQKEMAANIEKLESRIKVSLIWIMP